MAENNHEVEEENHGINIKYLVLGGGLIAVGGAGIYYIYHQNQLINEYTSLVDEYRRELKEYGEDGEITEDEQKQLDRKREAMQTLEQEIQGKGWIGKLIEALKAGGIFVGIPWITIKVIDLIRKRWPPKPPNYKCPICDKNLHTRYRLKRHINNEHDVEDADKAADPWQDIQNLPRWIQQWIATVSGLGTTLFDYLQHSWNELDRTTQIMLIGVLVAAITAVIAASFGTLSPTLGPIEASLAACMV